MDFYSQDPRAHSLIVSIYAAIHIVAAEWVHTIRNLLAILVACFTCGHCLFCKGGILLLCTPLLVVSKA